MALHAVGGSLWIDADHYSDPLGGVDTLTEADTPRCLLCRPPLGGIDTLTDGVTLRPSHVPPQLQANGVQKQGSYSVIILNITYTASGGFAPRQLLHRLSDVRL